MKKIWNWLMTSNRWKTLLADCVSVLPPTTGIAPYMPVCLLQAHWSIKTRSMVANGIGRTSAVLCLALLLDTV